MSWWRIEMLCYTVAHTIQRLKVRVRLALSWPYIGEVDDEMETTETQTP